MSQPYPGQYGASGPDSFGPPKQSSGAKTVLIVLGVIGGILALCVLACCGGIFYVSYLGKQRFAEVAQDMEAMETEAREAKEQIRRDMESRQSQAQRSTPARTTPRAPEPVSAAEALTALQSNDSERQQSAMRWLARTAAADQPMKGYISAALVELLDDAEARAPALLALKTWGDEKAVTAVMEQARMDSPARREALETLAEIGDETASAVLAEMLEEFAQTNRAKQALQRIGPAAEKDVIKFFNSPDSSARRAARDLLRRYDTKQGSFLMQCAKDLHSTDIERKKLAAHYLLTVPPGESHRSEVAMALEAGLTESNPFARDAIVKAMKKWVAPINRDGLVQLLKHEDRNTSQAAMAVLAKLNDPTVAKPIAHNLTDFFKRGETSRILREMGSVAQYAVIEYLTHSDHGVRREAVLILQDIGTRDCLPALQRAARDHTDRGMQGLAKQAFNAILRSGRVSKPEMRMWSDTSGNFKVEAAFLDIFMGKIRLQEKNGKTVMISLTKLSPRDQAYIKDELQLRRLLRQL